MAGKRRADIKVNIEKSDRLAKDLSGKSGAIRENLNDYTKSRKFFHFNKGKAWFVINMFFSIVYLMWRTFFTIPFEYGIVSIVAGIFLLIVEALGMVEAFVHYMNMYSVADYPLPEIAPEEYPDVDVFIATYSEEPELLYKTLNGCLHMDYPDKRKVHIYLCDDNRRPEMRELAARMGVNYLDRPTNEGAKAGNLNNALQHSDSPYLVTFDADMIPQRRFLMRTIPYFVDAEKKNRGLEEKDKIKLGFVQSPQSFYNPDLFQFNLFSEGRIPNEQDYFYKDIQVARTRTNSVIYGGSNTVLSREALNAAGGFYTGAITEDFATGILIEKAGFVSLGIGEPLASGMSPTDLPNLVQQRIRWARGVIATGRKMHIYTSRDFSFAQKMNYWASIWYWYAPLKRLIYVLAPILYATFNFMVFKCTLPQVLLFWLPMYISSNISLRMLSGNIRTTKWTGIYETVMFPFMLIPVTLESFGITLKKFKVTKKEAVRGEKENNLLYLIPFLILIILSVIGIVRCIIVMFDSGSFGPIVVLFWLLSNLFFLVMSTLFVDGRIPYRKAERVPLSVPAEVRTTDDTLCGKTRDVSENGLSIIFEKPYYLETGEKFDVTMSWAEYRADLLCELVFVSQAGENWNYSMRIEDYRDCYDDWLQIIYDRVPPLPLEIKKDSGIFDDLKINAKKRVETPFFQKRQYPRILLDTDVACPTLSAGTVHVNDFNYVFLNLRIPEATVPEKLTVSFFEGISLSAAFRSEKNGDYLFEVSEEEMNAVFANKPLYYELLDWLSETNRIAMMDASERKKQQIRKERQERKESLQEFDETALLFGAVPVIKEEAKPVVEEPVAEEPVAAEPPVVVPVPEPVVEVSVPEPWSAEELRNIPALWSKEEIDRIPDTWTEEEKHGIAS